MTISEQNMREAERLAAAQADALVNADAASPFGLSRTTIINGVLAPPIEEVLQSKTDEIAKLEKRIEELNKYWQMSHEESIALKAQVNALRDALRECDVLAKAWIRNNVMGSTVFNMGASLQERTEKAISSTPEQCLDDVIKQAREKALDEANNTAKDAAFAWAEDSKDYSERNTRHQVVDVVDEAILELKGK